MSSFLASDTDESWTQENDNVKVGRSGRRRSNKKPNYKLSSSDDGSFNSGSDDGSDNDAILVDSDVEEEKKAAAGKNVSSAAAASKKKATTTTSLSAATAAVAEKSPPPVKKSVSTKNKSPAKMTRTTAKNDGGKLAPSPVGKKSTNDKDDHVDGGVDIVIPYSFLKGNKNECTVLVQVEDNDDQSHHLDFHGQSGAVVVLDLKGYQYRGHIRPGPTAMIVAVNRDGQLKVEAITDEFVTLDTSTKTDVMAKLDAVVSGDMDDGYKVREENVNIADKDKVEGGSGDKKGKKRTSTAKKSSPNATAKRKVSISKKKS